VGDFGDDSEFSCGNENPAGRGIWEKNARELNCFERVKLSRIKAHMNSINFNRLYRAFVAAVLAVAAFDFLPAAKAFAIIDPMDLTNAAPKAIPRRASIIFIQVDGLGYGDLSCYGQTNFQTPNLDKLAADGIRFTNYSITAANSPTRSSLLAGKNLGGLKQSADADILIAAQSATVEEVLKNSGYHTGYIGEWNLGGENSGAAPWQKGFDEFGGYLNSKDAENFYASFIWSLPPHFSYDKASATFVEWEPSQGPHIGGKEMIYANTQGKRQYIPDLLTKAALNFILNNLPDQFNHYQPFFLLVNYKIPNGKIEVPTDAPFSEENWPQPEKNRAALISRIDGYVGELQEQLQKKGMTNNVVIFFSSASVPKKTDLIDPEFFHSNIATNDFRVPMIVRWPGKIPAGRDSGFKWSPQDFLPTAAEIGYANSPTNIDGISVLPELLGQAKK
jgi:arylsulfatase A-like enzyme